ncbi:MAG: PBSX family phage terminase large subunit [Gammaproteobacteria bacterium]|nr:MAG: PBSX family phage terminase large subunit [Gammaproteobacteria bacterium]
MPEMQCPEKLLPLIETPKRIKVVIGGRGSAKSMTVGDICLMDAQTKGIKTACFREYQNSIDDSVYALLKEEVTRLELDGFTVQNSRILHKDQDAFKFRGMARNPEGIKSMQGFNRFWVEEAQTASYKSIRAIMPTLREEESELWLTGNPQSVADPFSQRFIKPFEKHLLKDGFYEDDMHLIIKCNYSDNPFFPAVLEQERQYDKENLSTAEYNHVWLGGYNDEVKDSIIPVDWFDAAIDAHKKLGFGPVGPIIAAHDPSDRGGDGKGYALRHGSVVLDAADLDSGDVNEGCDWAIDRAIEARADVYAWDCDGLGVSLKRQTFQAFDGKKTDLIMFKGSETPEDPDRIYEPVQGESRHSNKNNRDIFKNKRAQYYWRLRDRFYKTYQAVVHGKYIDPDELISLSSNIKAIDQLRAEVCRIPLNKRSLAAGKIQIMSKLDMLAMGISSPNMADSIMMLMGDKTATATRVRLNLTSEF